jgi:hypothetical protein
MISTNASTDFCSSSSRSTMGGIVIDFILLEYSIHFSCQVPGT